MPQQLPIHFRLWYAVFENLLASYDWSPQNMIKNRDIIKMRNEKLVEDLHVAPWSIAVYEVDENLR